MNYEQMKKSELIKKLKQHIRCYDDLHKDFRAKHLEVMALIKKNNDLANLIRSKDMDVLNTNEARIEFAETIALSLAGAKKPVKLNLSMCDGDD